MTRLALIRLQLMMEATVVLFIGTYGSRRSRRRLMLLAKLGVFSDSTISAPHWNSALGFLDMAARENELLLPFMVITEACTSASLILTGFTGEHVDTTT